MYSDIIMNILVQFMTHCQILLRFTYVHKAKMTWLGHQFWTHCCNKLHKIAQLLFHTLSSEITYLEASACSGLQTWQQAVYVCSWNDTIGFLLDIAICLLNLQ